MPHTHHCDNPVIINTNLSASARGAKVLWCWSEGGGKRKGRHAKYWSWYCHLWLRDQAASVNVTVHTGQSDKRKANSCSSFCPECCGFYITQEEVGRSHAHIQRKEEKENNPHQDLCPNGAHYCNYKAQISDQALRWLAKNVQKTKSSVIIICLLCP